MIISFTMIDKDYNSNISVKVRCKICGFKWLGVPFNMLTDIINVLSDNQGYIIFNKSCPSNLIVV